MGYQVHFSYFYGKPLNYDYRDHTRNSNSYSRSQHLAPLFEAVKQHPNFTPEQLADWFTKEQAQK